MNTSTSLKPFHVILFKSKYSRLSFSGNFLFINLPAFNNAVINTDCAKIDGGAATCLALVTFDVLLLALKNYQGLVASVFSLFSKNLNKKYFFPFHLLNINTRGALLLAKTLHELLGRSLSNSVRIVCKSQ